MANKTINGLTVTTSAAAADLVPIWVAGSAVTRRITKVNFIGATLTGGGTIATGGYTLTVPATGTAALREASNIFTATQTVNVASDGNVVQFQRNGTTVARVYQVATQHSLVLDNRDNGAGEQGGLVLVGANTNASNSTPGAFGATRADGVGVYYIWPDGSGVWRTGAVADWKTNHESATVVGAQTSMAEAKHITVGLSPIADVLERIAAGADAVRRFTYKSGAFNDEVFEGVVVDYAPEYGMDRDDTHPAGKSLNEINIIGDLLRAVAWLSERVAILEAK